MCRQVFRPVNKRFLKLWEYCPKGNPYPPEVCVGRFDLVNYAYREKMIKFKDNSYCIVRRCKYCPKRGVVCDNVNLLAVINRYFVFG